MRRSRPLDDLRWDVFANCRDDLEWLTSALPDPKNGYGRVVFVIGQEDSGRSALVKKFADEAKENRRVLIASVVCERKEEAALSWPLDKLISELEGQHLWSRIVTLFRKARRVFGGVVGAAVGGSAGLTMKWLPDAAGFLIQKLPGLVQVILGALGFLLGWRFRSAWTRKPIDTLKEMAKRRTLLLVLDDLDSADPQFYPLFLELCRAIQDKQAKARALIVATSRPLDENHPLWELWQQVTTESYDSVDRDRNLDELRKDQRWKRGFVDAYVDAVFEPNNLGDELRNGIVEWTQGNPLWVKEALWYCKDEGWISKVDNRWVQTQRIGPIDPLRLKRRILLRLSKLPGEERKILQLAAVEASITGRFTLEVLSEILGRTPQQITEELTGKLGKQGGWVIQGKPSERRHFYRFQYSLYRKVIYDECDELRTELHAQVGFAMKTVWSEDWPKIAEDLAEHFREGRCWKEAEICYKHLRDKWSRQKRREKLPAALDGLADTLLNQPNRVEEADSVLESLIQEARDCDNVPLLLNALTKRVKTIFELGRFAEAAPLMEEVMVRHTHAEPSAEFYFLSAVSLFASRELERAKVQIETGINAQELDTDRGAIVDACGWLDELLTQDPTLPGARETISELKALALTP